MLGARWRRLATLLAFAVAFTATISGTGAVAVGSGGPIPYTVTADGVTLPSGASFPANGHVNYRATKLDGTGEKSFGVHFDPNNKQPGGRFIGKSFFGFTNYPATAQYGAITNSAASAFPGGYCITWVQVSKYNEHFGEGGQQPVCTSTPPKNECVTSIDTENVKAYYTTDPFNAKVKYTGKELCDGITKTVSLNSYKAEGPTWETSGTQSFFDHDEFTISKGQTTGTLQVKEPSCYYQTDLYWGDTMFDGIDGALPHYPDTVTPTDLIDARNGGTGCSSPPKTIEIPHTPATVDECGPGNATWIVPSDTNLLEWTLLESGHLTVAITEEDIFFTDGTTLHDYGVAPDSGEPCPPEEGSAVPTEPRKLDKCEPMRGETRDRFIVPNDPNFQYTWNGGLVAPGKYPAPKWRYVLKAVPTPGVTLEQGALDRWVLTFTKKACEVSRPAASVRAYCVTEHFGEGIARLSAKRSTVTEHFRIIRSGKDRVVKVRPGTVKSVALRGLHVGSIVKVVSKGKVLDRAKIHNRCSTPNVPDTGLRTKADGG